VFLFGGDETEIVEEYEYKTNTWKTANMKLKNLKNSQTTISLPASLFSYLPGNCKGVE